MLIGKQWHQQPEFIPPNSNSGFHSCIGISVTYQPTSDFFVYTDKIWAHFWPPKHNHAAADRQRKHAHLSMSRQMQDTKPKTGQMGIPGELWFLCDMLLTIGTVPENPGWMVTLGWTPGPRWPLASYAAAEWQYWPVNSWQWCCVAVRLTAPTPHHAPSHDAHPASALPPIHHPPPYMTHGTIKRVRQYSHTNAIVSASHTTEMRAITRISTPVHRISSSTKASVTHPPPTLHTTITPVHCHCHQRHIEQPPPSSPHHRTIWDQASCQLSCIWNKLLMMLPPSSLCQRYFVPIFILTAISLEFLELSPGEGPKTLISSMFNSVVKKLNMVWLLMNYSYNHTSTFLATAAHLTHHHLPYITVMFCYYLHYYSHFSGKAGLASSHLSFLLRIILEEMSGTVFTGLMPVSAWQYFGKHKALTYVTTVMLR